MLKLSPLQGSIKDFLVKTKTYSIKTWFAIGLTFFTFMVAVLICFTITKGTYIEFYKSRIAAHGYDELVIVSQSREKWRSLSEYQTSQLSRLGQILFLDKKPPKLRAPEKNYSILIWNYEEYIETRPHMHQSAPFQNCSVTNCLLKKNNNDIASADIIVFDLSMNTNYTSLNISRKQNQIWTFLTDKSPLHILGVLQTKNLYDNLFNWSMTYRMDSDIPIPYGRTVALHVGEKVLMPNYSQWNKNKKQDVLVACVNSHTKSSNHRWKYVKFLQQYLQIDTYGIYGDKICPFKTPINVKKDCAEISKYKFYLAFEDTNFAEYITENVWWYGYAKNAIPIVMGGSADSYRQILPPDSFLNIENFVRPSDLANYIIYLNKTPSDIYTYFAWKKDFKILNEHGHFRTQSVQYCRICEALNYNSKNNKSYTSLNLFGNPKQCNLRWDLP